MSSSVLNYTVESPSFGGATTPPSSSKLEASTSDSTSSQNDLDQAIVECIPSISNVVAHYFKTQVEREDALQDILTQLILKKSSFRGDRPFSHWALRISSRTCISRYRYQKIRKFFSIDHEKAQEVESNFSSPDSDLQESEHKALIHQAIEKLKPKDRELVLLCDIMRKNDQEAQEILNIKTSGAFRVRKHRAREKLKTILVQMGYQHEA